jgi:hypothetical protein
VRSLLLHAKPPNNALQTATQVAFQHSMKSAVLHLQQACTWQQPQPNSQQLPTAKEPSCHPSVCTPQNARRMMQQCVTPLSFGPASVCGVHLCANHMFRPPKGLNNAAAPGGPLHTPDAAYCTHSTQNNQASKPRLAATGMQKNHLLGGTGKEARHHTLLS